MSNFSKGDLVLYRDGPNEPFTHEAVVHKVLSDNVIIVADEDNGELETLNVSDVILASDEDEDDDFDDDEDY